MSLQASYYKGLLLSTQRGNYRGEFSNAKPLLLLSIIELIANGQLFNNKIVLNDVLSSVYINICHKLEPNKSPTNICKPYFHLNTETYYKLKFINNCDTLSQSSTPSAKFLREQVEYAQLDETLWELLQNESIREEYAEAIIQHFLKK